MNSIKGANQIESSEMEKLKEQCRILNRAENDESLDPVILPGN